MSPIYLLLIILPLLLIGFCVIWDARAGWKEREFWLDPHGDDEGYQP